MATRTITNLERDATDGGVMVAHWRVITCDCDWSAEEAHVQSICNALFPAAE